MENYENGDHRRHILKEFGKVDVFYAQFKNDFNLSLIEIINDKLKTAEYNAQLFDTISIYGQEIINATESVIDKDLNYPEYRLAEELDRIRKVVSQLPTYDVDDDFINQLHKQVKVLMVDYFIGIFNLTANGFRLLEQSAKMHTLRFLYTYHTIVHRKLTEL